VRFTKAGTISTPLGPHTPIPTETFRNRVSEWHARVKNTDFVCADFAETMSEAKKGDVVYCDPPYVYTQAILYGAQAFRLERLWEAIEGCVSRGARVLLSIDGKKKSGTQELLIHPPEGLFKREVLIDCGRSMLRRFQRGGETLEDEVVHDRLMLTW
jgi:DNA adenine methylase